MQYAFHIVICYDWLQINCDCGIKSAGLVYVTNVVDYMLPAEDKEISIGQAYHASDGANVPWPQYVNRLADGENLWDFSDRTLNEGSKKKDSASQILYVIQSAQAILVFLQKWADRFRVRVI